MLNLMRKRKTHIVDLEGREMAIAGSIEEVRKTRGTDKRRN